MTDMVGITGAAAAPRPSAIANQLYEPNIGPFAGRPVPQYLDWKPDMGHVAGASYDWDYWTDPVRNPLSRAPQWLGSQTWQSPNYLGGSAEAIKRQPPGFPLQISAQSLLGREGEDFWTQGPGGVVMGAVPGQQQGGAISPFGFPIATLPLTLANAPMYAREGLLALITGPLGGYRYQNTGLDQPEMPRNPDLIDNVVGGIRTIGDAASSVFDGVAGFNRQMNVASRITSVADLYLDGNAEATIIDRLTTFGGAERKFSLQALTEEAQRNGWDVTDSVAKLWDLPREVIEQIKSNPQQFASPMRGVALAGGMAGPGTAAWDMAAGLPFSLDPAVNMAVETAHFAAGIGLSFAVGGPLLGFARGVGSGLAGVRGAQAASALTRGLSGIRGVETAGAIARGAYLTGRTARLIAQASALNNAAGLTVRGLEYGIKQYAVVAGDRELAAAMDRLLWEMPLSMNPGLNLMAGALTHPLEVGKQLAKGRLPIGRAGHVGEVGAIDVGRRAVTALGEPDVVLTLAGRPLTLQRSARRALGTIHSMDLDTLHSALLRKVEWPLATLRTYVGEGSGFEINVRDIKDFVWYTYLQAAREQAGHLGAALPGATMLERTNSFLSRYQSKVWDMLQSDLDGRTSYFNDTVRGQFWDLAKRNDSGQAKIKANLQTQYDPLMGMADAMSWIRASKAAGSAFNTRLGRLKNAPRYRETVNLEAIEDFRRNVLEGFAPDQVVPTRALDQLKRMGGMIETRGLGVRLQKRPGASYNLTRSEVEEILDSVESIAKRERTGAPPPGVLTNEELRAAEAEAPTVAEAPGAPVAAAAEQGGPAAPVEQQGPPPVGIPPLGAEARVTGVSMDSVRLLREMESAGTDVRAVTEVPSDVVRWYGRWREMTATQVDEYARALAARDRGQLWDDIIEAWKARREEVIRGSAGYNALEDFARLAAQRIEAGELPADEGALVLRDIGIMQDNLANPIGFAEAYTNTPVLRTYESGRQYQGRVIGREERAWQLHEELLAEGGREGPAMARDVAADIRAGRSDQIFTTEVEAEHPGLGDQFAQARNEALIAATAIREMPERPSDVGAMRFGAVADETPGKWAVPLNFDNLDVEAAEALIRGHLDSPDLTAEQQAILREPNVHPLRKAAMIREAVDQGELSDAAKAMLTKVPENVATLEEATSRWRSYDSSFEEIAGLAAHVGRRFALAPRGGYSPEMLSVTARFVDQERLGGLPDNGRLPVAKEVKSRQEQREAIKQAESEAALAQHRANLAEQARTQLQLRTGEFTALETVATAHGRKAAELALDSARMKEPGFAFRLVQRNSYYDIVRGQRDVPRETIPEPVPEPVRVVSGEAETFMEAVPPGNAEVPRAAESLQRVAEGTTEPPLQLSSEGRFVGVADFADDEWSFGPERWNETVAMLGGEGEPGEIELRQREGSPTLVSFDDEGQPNGFLQIVEAEGKPSELFVHVRPDARRQGVASRLYDQAQAEGFDIRAISGESTTEAGSAFSEAYWQRREAQPPAADIADLPPYWQERVQRAERPTPELRAYEEVLARTDLTPAKAKAAVKDLRRQMGEGSHRDRLDEILKLPPQERAKAARAEAARMRETIGHVRAYELDFARRMANAEPTFENLLEMSQRSAMPPQPPEVLRMVADLPGHMPRPGGGDPMVNWQVHQVKQEALESLGVWYPSNMRMDDMDILLRKLADGAEVPTTMEARHALMAEEAQAPAAVSVAGVELPSEPSSQAFLNALSTMAASPHYAREQVPPLYARMSPAERLAIESLMGRLPKKVSLDNPSAGVNAWKSEVGKVADALRQRGDDRPTAGTWYDLPDGRQVRYEATSMNAPSEVEVQGGEPIPFDTRAEAEQYIMDQRRAAPPTPASAPEAAPVSATGYGVATSFPNPMNETEQIPATFRLVDESELVTSADEGFNPALQPRQRERAASREQIADLSGRFDANLALRLESGSDGPPVVGPDNMVLAGNGRTMAMRLMDEERWVAYHDALRDRAAEFGINPEDIGPRTVLVREVAPEVMTPQMAQALNARTGGQSSAEMAVAISRMVTPEDITALGDIGDKVVLREALKQEGRVDFNRRILGTLTPEQQRSFVDAKGDLSDDGARLVANAMLARVIPDPALAARLIEAPEDLVMYRNGLEQSLGQLVQAVGRTEAAGVPDPGAGALIAGGLRMIADLNARGVPKREWAPQFNTIGMFGGDQTNTAALALSQMRSQAEVVTFLRAYASALEDNITIGMFEAQGTASSLFNRGIDAINDNRRGLSAERRAGKTKEALSSRLDLTPDDELPRVPEADGRTMHASEGPAGETTIVTERPVIDPTTEAAIGAAGGPLVHRGDLDALPPDATAWVPRTLAEAGAMRNLMERQEFIVTDRPRVNLGSHSDDPYSGEHELNVRNVLNGLMDDKEEQARRWSGMIERMAEGTAPFYEWALVKRIAQPWRFNDQGVMVGEFQFIKNDGSRARIVDEIVAEATAARASLRGKEIRDPSDLGVAGETLFVHGSQKVSNPIVRQAAGGDEYPETAPIRQAADEGRRVIVSDTDATLGAAAKEAADAPRTRKLPTDPDHVFEWNEPDAKARADQIDADLLVHRSEAEAARERAAALPRPEGVDPVFSDLDTARLYHRFAYGPEIEGTPIPPGSAYEVFHTMQALDTGGQGADPAMSVGEAERLRAALHGWSNRYLDRAEQRRRPGGPSRGGAAPPGRPPAPPASPPGPDDFVPPGNRLDMEVAEVLQNLSRVVLEDPSATPLRGFEGTQYDFGPVPDIPGRPGLVFENYLDQIDAVIPGVKDEILYGRKQEWSERVRGAQNARAAFAQLMTPARRLTDMLIGSRPEATIIANARANFEEDVLGPMMHGPTQMGIWKDAPARSLGAAQGDLAAILRAWDEHRQRSVVPHTSVQWFRRTGLIPAGDLERIAREVLRKRGGKGGKLPAWYTTLQKRNSRFEHPLAEAWFRADNRIRNAFQQGPLAGALRLWYDNRVGRKVAAGARGITVFYHFMRFPMDVRWMGLEASEASILTFSREGLGTTLRAHNIEIDPRTWRMRKLKVPKGELAPELAPLSLSEADLNRLSMQREQWHWWSQITEFGSQYGRARYVLANVASRQERELPKVLTRMAHEDRQLAEMLHTFGATPQDWLHELDAMWDLRGDINRAPTSPLVKSEKLSRERAASLYRPFLERGVLTPAEFEEMVKAGRHTPNQAITAELARLDDPVLQPLMERLAVLNDQFWSDATGLIFGQADRSNLQRFMNHPMLWWPTSYMVKATKWLAGVLFDRAFGRDTGMLGAITLTRLHQRHSELLQSDPEYAKFFKDRATLFFVAQMFLPVTPYDIGVSLSPMTRELVGAALNDQSYRRNFFSWGPFYTFTSLLPRLAGELEGLGGPAGAIGERAGILFPQTYTVKPSTSRLSEAEATAALRGNGESEPTPFEQQRPMGPQGGNIDLNNRPVVRNPDGSISTVRSITIEADGRYYLIPTVVGGRVVSNDDAIAYWRKTHQQLGVFGSEAEADRYAQSLHESQARQYAQP